MIQAWHFVGETLRDGSPIPRNGRWLHYSGTLKMCESGLHASRDPFDALQYARGDTLCLVECGGTIIEQNDKVVCSKRRIVRRMDATDMLLYFARMQALSVIHLWDAPDVVCDYVMTGDDSLRDAAKATSDAAGGAAAMAAWSAARVAWSAAGAAWAAVGYAAWAAGNAARDAARDAARQDFNELVRECFWQ